MPPISAKFLNALLYLRSFSFFTCPYFDHDAFIMFNTRSGRPCAGCVPLLWTKYLSLLLTRSACNKPIIFTTCYILNKTTGRREGGHIARCPPPKYTTVPYHLMSAIISLRLSFALKSKLKQ